MVKLLYAHSQGLTARILKLPIIFERVPIQNGLKLYKMVQNGQFLPLKNESSAVTGRHDALPM